MSNPLSDFPGGEQPGRGVGPKTRMARVWAAVRSLVHSTIEIGTRYSFSDYCPHFLSFPGRETRVSSSASDARTVRTIADFAAPGVTVGTALLELADVWDRGIVTEDEHPRIPWARVLREARLRAARALGAPDATSGGATASGIPASAPLLPCDRPPHIGLLLENTPEYVYWLCAAAMSPLVAVGLNDTRAPAALARDLDTADVGLVVYDAGHAELAGLLASHTAVPVISADEALGGSADAVFDGAGEEGDYADPDRLVALVFTSGSTGDPKAVRVTQRKIAAPAAMLADRFGLGAGDCIYNAMPLFHSNAVLVAWPISVFTGCELALRRRFSASRWLADVRRHGATFANYVGTPLSYILSTAERDDDTENPMRIVYGNEAGEEVRRRFAERFGVRVVDGFGSTEGGVAVSRTPETPPAALGPLPAGASVIDPESEAPCAVARFSGDGALANADEAVGELVGRRAGIIRRLLRQSRGRCRANAGRPLPHGGSRLCRWRGVRVLRGPSIDVDARRRREPRRRAHRAGAIAAPLGRRGLRVRDPGRGGAGRRGRGDRGAGGRRRHDRRGLRGLRGRSRRRERQGRHRHVERRALRRRLSRVPRRAARPLRAPMAGALARGRIDAADPELQGAHRGARESGQGGRRRRAVLPRRPGTLPGRIRAIENAGAGRIRFSPSSGRGASATGRRRCDEPCRSC
ncbi:AMP-binding protein [Dietzia sp.]|uniref:AMP-binding protein n=1 Tax=Dietzia sp. TaxID=1871616 RepID=UPI002FD98104